MGPSESTVRVVVIEDHEMVAAAFQAALDADRRLSVVGVAHDLDDGVAEVARHRPDLVITDLRLDGLEAASELGRLSAAEPAVRILVVTGWATERSLFACLDHGAHGFIAKTQTIDEFIDAAVRVAAGETVVAPHLLPALVRHFGGRDRRSPDQLTPREAQVLQLLSEGLSTAAMATALGLSVNTVRNHVGAVMTKLGAHSRLEAVNTARQRDLVAPPEPG